MPKLFPPSLSGEVSRPLLAAAERIRAIAPWEFMSDLELIGMRAEDSGELYVASVLGALRTMFAVVIYRNDAGLRSIHNLVTTRTPPDSDASLEELDYLKVEWCRKRELSESDLGTLAAAGYKPKGKGPIWPRFESARPGWHPWGLTESEARLMTELLAKVARFVRLRETRGPLHHEPIEATLPIIPAGEEATLTPEQIDWLPFVPRPASPPEPVILSAEEQETLARLPVGTDFVVEVIAPLAPELAFIDEAAGLPCLARVAFMVEQRSGYMLCADIAHGAKPLREIVGPSFIKALRKAKARPAVVRVQDQRLAAVLQSACEPIGVPLRQTPLHVAPQAWLEFRNYFGQQTPR